MKDNLQEMQQHTDSTKNLNKDMFRMLKEIKEELKIEKDIRATREDEIGQLRKQIINLTEELRKLTKKREGNETPTERGLSYASAASTNASPPPPPVPVEPTKTLLIGTSLLRNVNPDKLVNCDLITKGGAKIDDLTQIIASMPLSREYKEVTLVAGSIDIESGSKDDVLSAFKAFAVCAADKTKKIRISSVLPRGDKNYKTEIDAINEELKHMCNTDDHEFIDNDPTFHLMNGHINKALLNDDGLHLSQAGVESLLKTLGMITKGSPYSTKKYGKKQNRILFKGHEHPLSNFYPIKGLRVFGKQFFTSEAAYQHEKAKLAGNDTAARRIEESRTGIQAMRLGSSVKSPEEWPTQRIKVMERVIHAKLSTCKEARDALLDSGTCEIVEDTSHPFWACGLDGRGQNMMGKILMNFRTKLRDDPGQFQFQVPNRHFQNSRNWATRSQQPRCYRCGEAGHVQDQCGHRQEVFCWECDRQGHKQKFCHYYTQQNGNVYM